MCRNYFSSFSYLKIKHHWADNDVVPNQKFARFVMKEWQILAQSLPANIFVRTYRCARLFRRVSFAH